MATIPSKQAADWNPLWTPNHFAPLGRRPTRRAEPAAPLEVLEPADDRVLVRTRNTT